MKLIDLLVKELPNLGGWPEGAVECCRHYGTNSIDFYDETGNWDDDCYLKYGKDFAKDCIYEETSGSHCLQSISRSEYESALAASKAVVGHNGWIQWTGGECPVDSDTIVDVICRNQNQYQFNNDRAGDFNWSHDGFGGDIIAYRLQKPTKSEQAGDDASEADDEADLNECIGQDVDIPEWNGEGLPPVGLICEGRFHRHPGISFEWQECLVLYVFERECAVKSKSTSTLHYCDEFRPLRTEAEKAREDAETAIRTCLAGTGAGITPLAAKGIYEAIADGKIPGVKLEGK